MNETISVPRKAGKAGLAFLLLLVLLACLFVLLIKSLISAGKKPETESTKTKTKIQPHIPPDLAGKPFIPANSGGKSYVMPLQQPFVPAATIIPPPLPIIPAIKIQPEILVKKTITRENMEFIFNHGERKLNRKAAVAALVSLGFGKSAAYDALLEDGRFAFCLQFAADGIITWKG